jgi:hypothetical protein
MKLVDYMRPNPWRKIEVKNKTVRTLSNGTLIPSESKMMRLAHKSGK